MDQYQTHPVLASNGARYFRVAGTGNSLKNLNDMYLQSNGMQPTPMKENDSMTVVFFVAFLFFCVLVVLYYYLDRRGMKGVDAAQLKYMRMLSAQKEQARSAARSVTFQDYRGYGPDLSHLHFPPHQHPSVPYTHEPPINHHLPPQGHSLQTFTPVVVPDPNSRRGSYVITGMVAE